MVWRFWPRRLHGTPLARSGSPVAGAIAATAVGVAVVNAQTCENHQVAGRYRVRPGLAIDISLTSEALFQGRWNDTSRVPLLGRLVGNCFGLASPSGIELSFRRQDDGLVWSDGEVWLDERITTTTTKRMHVRFGGIGSSELSDEELANSAGPVAEAGPGTEADQVATTVATMLFGMFFTSVGLLYLVNYTDPDIRMYSYTMISTTMSVFAAVLCNQAIVTFIFSQVLAGKFPRGLNIPITTGLKWKVGLVYLAFAWMLMSVICWKNRIDARLLRSFSGLGSHLLGFAGIFAFDAVLVAVAELEVFGLITLVVVFAVAYMYLLKLLAKELRHRFLRGGAKDEGEEGGSSSSEPHHGAIIEDTEDIIDEAEDEAISLVTAFLVVLVICHHMLGEFPSLEERQHGVYWRETSRLIGCGLLFALLSGVTRVVAKRWFEDQGRQHVEHFMLLVVKTEAMASSWCFLWGSLWSMQLDFQGSGWVTQKLMRVINAFCVSTVCVALIFLLDKVADTFEDRRQRQQKKAADEKEDILSSIERARTMCDEAIQAGARGGTERKKGRGVLISDIVHVLGGIVPNAPGVPLDHEISTLIRISLNSLGFLVALSWDKAFDSAEETVVMFVTEVLDFHHEVIVKVVLAALLAGFVVPAWMWYIVPIGMKDREHHAADVRRHKRRTSLYAAGSLGHGALELVESLEGSPMTGSLSLVNRDSDTE
mmetsp:Transcript_56283/g.163205  ORF Transcript_56283/g.163205 Transcript_56283/m.163205 type:complete len:710 (+) Transcript_56283:61-2190(+)